MEVHRIIFPSIHPLKGCLDYQKNLWTTVKKPEAFGGKIPHGFLMTLKKNPKVSVKLVGFNRAR